VAPKVNSVYIIVKGWVPIMKEKAINVLMYICIICCLSVGAAALYLGQNKGNVYYWVFMLAIPFIIASYECYKRVKGIKLERKLRSEWGKADNRKRSMDTAGELFEKLKQDDGPGFFIDDQTWEDLNMDSVFMLLDRTLSTPGEQQLYYMLRTPLFQNEPLEKRKAIIGLFQKDEKMREFVRLKLWNMGRAPRQHIASLLWDKTDPEVKDGWLYSLMALLALAACVTPVFMGPKAFITYLFPVYIINNILHYKAKQNVENGMSALAYINRIGGCAKGIANCEFSLGDYKEQLNVSLDKCQGVFNSIGMALFSSGNELAEMAGTIFLIQERNYCSSFKKIVKHKENIKKLYMLLGELDALMSVASYRQGLEYYCEPQLEQGRAYIDLKDGVHPLIEKPVANSLYIENRGVLITGSNMSGKSTFLRTLGVNALFAQTIGTCLAHSYNGAYIRIITSISRTDNIMGGKSYYLSEAESLLRIIKEIGGSTPVLSIIDEIFRGTNSIERINASEEILRALAAGNSLSIAATHDLELGDRIGDCYDFYHFSEDVNKEGLSFDYTIKEGLSTTRNAVRIMEYLGYPKAMITKINSRISSLVKEG
jgi:hypothetical protein